eukprot:CAMPEP_0202964766 /NCGR_PEP_ID=MMETSP1396-20130829/8867_1 /ASSEMBLY_ACC=CAM_ASM_000872 /TAXON_ID= /ORGANISM="Pseudokeronopsis sp., Strain Brazil" /LENGTH=88 /DNA_ID=CAMNT_0049687133 /DNA_START=181 /DNA_END=447 /DNA_ORIENTATION=+
MTQNGVAYLVLAEKKYPQKLAFLYLQDIAENFIEHVRNQHGGTAGFDYQSKIETIDNSYAFLKFEGTISRRKREYKDFNTNENIEKLN